MSLLHKEHVSLSVLKPLENVRPPLSDISDYQVQGSRKFRLVGSAAMARNAPKVGRSSNTRGPGAMLHHKPSNLTFKPFLRKLLLFNPFCQFYGLSLGEGVLCLAVLRVWATEVNHKAVSDFLCLCTLRRVLRDFGTWVDELRRHVPAPGPGAARQAGAGGNTRRKDTSGLIIIKSRREESGPVRDGLVSAVLEQAYLHRHNVHTESGCHCSLLGGG